MVCMVCLRMPQLDSVSYLPDRLPAILFPWLSAVALSSIGEYLLCWSLQLVVIRPEFSYGTSCHSCNVGTRAELSIQVNVIMEILFSI